MGLLARLKEWKRPVVGPAEHPPSRESDADPHSVALFGPPTPESFNEKDYLACNPDVAFAVKSGVLKSGREHFDKLGHLGSHKVNYAWAAPKLAQLRAAKAGRIAAVMKPDYAMTRGHDDVFDVLTPELRSTFGVINTKNVSSNDYDGETLAVIHQYREGLLLDCGAGSRSTYYDNVVNYEIVKYPSTDVVGVAEILPFADSSFDAVFSYAVLEHVKQPFLAAQEISRVLKPGGVLRVIVPFLQPLHGFPSHYFNMTQYGLATLFEREIKIEKQFVGPYLGPIWTMFTLLRAWHLGLPDGLRESFLDLTLRELLIHPTHLLDRDFVTQLSESASFEIASATGLVGRKRAS